MASVTRWMRRAVLLGSLALVTAVGLAGQTRASTGAQVEKGLQVYQAQCADCHGDTLQGLQGPALARDDLLSKWRDFESMRRFIHRFMPQGAGGTLSQEEAVNVTHFIFSRNGVGPDGFAHPAFRALWAVADDPVAARQAGRSWLWGPAGFAVAWEDYAEAPGGKRLVQYFDKTRMEITDIDGNPSGDGYVTNGLLARELVLGLIQQGNDRFALHRPANTINVAGDPDDRDGPTYASFSRLLGPAPASQAAVMATIDRAGNVGQNGALGNYTDYVQYVAETGHNIPRVFWDFLNSTGPINRAGQLETGPVFDPWWRPTGFPITEAYWARVKVDGQVRDVLIQVFQRRVLTYTPDNPPAFQVEMGNVGRHYYQWRYGNG
jgi:cytochrome c553